MRESTSLPVVESWFERRSFGDITLLYEPHVDVLVRCNIWHVRGQGTDLLVDSGMGIASLRLAARDLFGQGVIAVATHAHADHVGGMHEFPERWIHAAEVEAARRGSNHLPLDYREWREEDRRAIESAGYAPVAGLVTAVPGRGFRLRDYRLHGFEPTRLLEEGATIDLGNRIFEVLHLPGHSSGSIGLFEHASGVLFSGDAIYDAPLLDQLPGSDPATYRLTMERLLRLPVTVVHAGHDPSFGRARLHEIARSYLARPSDRPAA